MKNLTDTKFLKLSGFASPFRYPGGKTKLAKFILDLIEINYKLPQKVVLVEPYAGGAGASLKLLLSKKVDQIIINDMDRAIYSFWKVAIEDPDYLIEKVKRCPLHINEWKKQKAIYTNNNSDLYSLSFASLYLNRTNRSGILEGGPIGGMHQTGEWKLDARFNKNTLIERLVAIKNVRNKIHVRNIDGVKLLEDLATYQSYENFLVFLDPPYFQKGCSLYLNHYKQEDHQKLEFFLRSTKLRWVMSYDNVDFISNLYKAYDVCEFAINHSAYLPRRGKELVIFSKLLNTVQINKYFSHD